MKDGNYYGIDFGTTNTSVVQYVCAQGKLVEPVKFSADGKDNLPLSSCIAISKDDVKDMKFGKSVKDHVNELASDYRIITSFKSFLGTDKEIEVAGERFNGKKLVGIFLKYVKGIVNKDDFTEAIFSIPVDFSSDARRDLLEAAEAADIKVKGFVSESSSAYISKIMDIKAYSKVLVIDWGGGTLDLSILKLKENRIYEEAVYGAKYGGDDIDKELAERISPKVFPDESFESLDPSKKDRLMRNIEQMKIAFSSSDDDYTILLGAGSKPLSMDYESFNEIIYFLITNNVIKPILDFMSKSNITPESIDAVILAGGSSQIRTFADYIKELFGEDKIQFDNDYQWMVAKGAALTSVINCEFKLSDDVSVLLSDNETFPIFKKDIDGVGSESNDITFSLVDDSSDAHFIFTDSKGKNKYGKTSVRTKGYYDEKIVLKAEIGKDQIARISISNSSISSDYKEEIELNKLKFYYDLNSLEE